MKSKLTFVVLGAVALVLLIGAAVTFANINYTQEGTVKVVTNFGRIERVYRPEDGWFTTLAPGPVHTEFQDVNEAHDFASRLPKFMWRTPEQVAEAALQGLEKGRRLVVPGVPNRVVAAIARFSPRPVVLRVMDST